MRKDYIYILIISLVLALSFVFLITNKFIVDSAENESPTLSYISPEYQELCFELGEEYNISPFILIAMIEVESSGKADAVNDSGYCVGLMQINMKDSVNEDINPYDPEQNIRTGIEILFKKAELVAGGDIAIELNLYNGQAIFDEVTAYSEKVLDRAYELERDYYEY